MSSEHNREELEELIAKEWTIGHYTFDEEKQCFYGDAGVELYLRELKKNTYQSCEYYYFDGYENGLSEDEVADLVFNGSRERVRAQAVEKYNAEGASFMGYPIIYTNVSVVIEMLNGESKTYPPKHAPKPKNVNRKAEELQFKYTTKWGYSELEIYLGAALHLSNNKIFLNETPNANETLTPIGNVDYVDDQYLVYDSFYKNNPTHFKINCAGFEGTQHIVNLIKAINEQDLDLSQSQNAIRISLDEDHDLSVSLENPEKNMLILLFYNQFREHFTIRFPDPSQNYKLGKCHIENNIVYIHAKGPDLNDENDKSEAGFCYEWELDFPPVILEAVVKLLEIAFKGRSESPLIDLFTEEIETACCDATIHYVKGYHKVSVGFNTTNLALLNGEMRKLNVDISKNRVATIDIKKDSKTLHATFEKDCCSIQIDDGISAVHTWYNPKETDEEVHFKKNSYSKNTLCYDFNNLFQIIKTYILTGLGDSRFQWREDDMK